MKRLGALIYVLIAVAGRSIQSFVIGIVDLSNRSAEVKLSSRTQAWITIAVLFFLVVAFFAPYADWPTNRKINFPPSLAHLRFASCALALYAADNDDQLPVADKWMSATQKYCSSLFLFCDPRNPDSRLSTSVNEPESGRYGLAFLAVLSGQKLSKIAEPETQVMVFPSTNLAWNASTTWLTAKAYRGSRKVPVGFANGSVSTVKDLREVDVQTGRWKKS